MYPFPFVSYSSRTVGRQTTVNAIPAFLLLLSFLPCRRRCCSCSYCCCSFSSSSSSYCSDKNIIVPVPIIPTFLLHLDKEAFDQEANQTAATHVPTNGSDGDTLVNESLVKHVFSLATFAGSENSRVGWLLSSKAIIQLIANPFVGPICSRYSFRLFTVLLCPESEFFDITRLWSLVGVGG